MDFPRSSGDGRLPGETPAPSGDNLLPFPETTVEAAPVAVAEPPPAEEHPRGSLWLQRLSLIVFVLFCVELGLLLAVIPWTTMWTENPFLAGYPNLRELLNNNFVRGAVTGIGLVDIWLGVREAVLYRER